MITVCGVSLLMLIVHYYTQPDLPAQTAIHDATSRWQPLQALGIEPADDLDQVGYKAISASDKNIRLRPNTIAAPSSKIPPRKSSLSELIAQRGPAGLPDFTRIESIERCQRRPGWQGFALSLPRRRQLHRQHLRAGERRQLLLQCGLLKKAEPETHQCLFREKPFHGGVHFCSLAAVGQVSAIAIQLQCRRL